MTTFLLGCLTGFILGVLCTAFAAWQWVQEIRDNAYADGIGRGRALGRMTEPPNMRNNKALHEHRTQGAAVTTKRTIIPKCLRKWRRHLWEHGRCTRTDGPRHCGATRNLRAKELTK